MAPDVVAVLPPSYFDNHLLFESCGVLVEYMLWSKLIGVQFGEA